MPNVGGESQARRRADRRPSGPTVPNPSAAETNMATAIHALDERTDESQDIAPDAPVRRSNTSEDGISAQDRIARRAYERFQMRGGEHGRDQDDWLEAERELNKAGDE
jgi:hypothetical protein